METREIKITRETAERWYNQCDKELKELALQTYPELKEPEYNIGEVYAFADDEVDFEKGFFSVSELEEISIGGKFQYGAKGLTVYKHIRKIEYKFLD
jgi:hypothetical protein